MRWATRMRSAHTLAGCALCRIRLLEACAEGEKGKTQTLHTCKQLAIETVHTPARASAALRRPLISSGQLAHNLLLKRTIKLMLSGHNGTLGNG